MPIRKQRVPVQGVSNRTQKNLFGRLSDTLSTNVQLLKPSQSLQSLNNSSKFQPKETNFQTIPNYQSQFTLLRNRHSEKINLNKLQQKQCTQKYEFPGKNSKHLQKSNSSNFIQRHSASHFGSNAQRAISKLRGIYKYKTNIKKIVKAWGFQNKAYINEEQFRNIMSKHFQTELTPVQATQIFKQVSKNYNSQNSQPKLDMPSFIGLIYNSVPFPNPRIDIDGKIDVSNQHAPLIKKIKNLNQINLYGKDSEDLKKIQRLPVIRKPVQKQPSTSFFLNQSLKQSSSSSIGQPSLYQTMYNSSSPKYSYSKTKQHAQFFTPLQYLQISQQKTRFNATPLLKLNDQSQPQNKRQKIIDQKLKIVAQLNSQKLFQKQRYENKLVKIRLNKQKQNIMIQQIDTKKQVVLKANLKKTWEENVAYQYVNFVNNDWK